MKTVKNHSVYDFSIHVDKILVGTGNIKKKNTAQQSETEKHSQAYGQSHNYLFCCYDNSLCSATSNSNSRRFLVYNLAVILQGFFLLCSVYCSGFGGGVFLSVLRQRSP